MDTGGEIIAAVTSGDAAKVLQLLAGDPALLGTHASTGETLVEIALYRGRLDMVDTLIAAGRQLNIWEAAALGPLDRVRELLDADPAAVNAYSRSGHFPLALAAFFGREDVADYLLNRGADVAFVSRNSLGVTALHAALANRHAGIARKLIERGADVNAAQPQGFRPLHSAAFHGQEEIVRMLLARGADARAATNDGVTALELAVQQGHRPIAELLREHTGARTASTH